VLDNLNPHVRNVLTALVTKQLAVDAEDLRPEANFIRDLGADSLDMVDIILQLEEQLSIRITEQEIVNMATVGEALRYLTDRLQAESGAAAETALLPQQSTVGEQS
jgi:acyl carrier protein